MKQRAGVWWSQAGLASDWDPGVFIRGTGNESALCVNAAADAEKLQSSSRSL